MPNIGFPAYPNPKGPPVKWDLAAVHKHLQTAVLLELHTIPLYLYPMYSIKSDTDSRVKMLSILKQEMLHLSLAGNIMCATGAQPRLYGKLYTPEYECNLFYDNAAELHLMPASKTAMAIYTQVEAPYLPPDRPKGNVLPDYHSIGQFYDALKAGLATLHETEKDALFQHNPVSQQFSEDDGVYYETGLITIASLANANTALDLIIDQGEGSTGLNTNITSHWDLFKLLRDREIDHYPLVMDPKTPDYHGKEIQKPMLAFDASYSYLLLSIEKCWAPNSPREDLIQNILGLMTDVMKPIAEFLVTQPLDDGSGENAGPPFNHFEFRSVATAHSQLMEVIKAATDAYPTDKMKKALKNADGLFDLAGLN
ncbi:hypothetical protein BDV93DRAFT_610515 [Ceratobasidium sp. AG-I]|nr:hypothetical protein BDV93DRAFT_610515 [Ceratobasidium sp. AG-I]